MEEKRVSPRTSMLGVSAKVSMDGNSWQDVPVRDISSGGLGFVSDVQSTKGDMFKIEGEVSDFARSMEFACDVKVVVCVPLPDGKFMCGVKYVDMPKAQQTGLSIFIELMVTKFPVLLVQ